MTDTRKLPDGALAPEAQLQGPGWYIEFMPGARDVYVDGRFTPAELRNIAHWIESAIAKGDGKGEV
jgi:hypothetical protein